MHRRPLLRLLSRYADRYPDDRERVERVRCFVQAHDDCFERSCLEGHVTASSWILSPDQRCVLLVHHRKLDCWLQPGGHADGDPDVLRVALREAREESGMARFELVETDGAVLPLDVDVHAIPERPGEPAHFHYDVRFLLVAAPGQVPTASGESNALRWFERETIEQCLREESLLRMERKARALSAPP